MPRPGRHPVDVIQRQGLGGHLHLPEAAQDGAQHVVVDDVAFQGATHQAGLHAAGLGDEIAPRLRRQDDRQRLLVATLGIRNLAVGGAGNGYAGQIVVLRHLGRGRHHHGLFPAAAAHGPGPQVGDHGLGAEQHQGVRVHQPGDDHPGQGFRDGLCQRPRQAHRGGGADLSEDVGMGRNAMQRRRLDHLYRVLCKPERRGDVIDVKGQERALDEVFAGARQPVAHRGDFADMFRV